MLIASFLDCYCIAKFKYVRNKFYYFFPQKRRFRLIVSRQVFRISINQLQEIVTLKLKRDRNELSRAFLSSLDTFTFDISRRFLILLTTNIYIFYIKKKKEKTRRTHFCIQFDTTRYFSIYYANQYIDNIFTEDTKSSLRSAFSLIIRVPIKALTVKYKQCNQSKKVKK